MDYFSFGMICLEMWLDETDEFARARELSKFRSAMTLPDAFLARHPYASKLILNLSATEPLKRPTANEILHSRALNEWNRETINNTNWHYLRFIIFFLLLLPRDTGRFRRLGSVDLTGLYLGFGNLKLSIEVLLLLSTESNRELGFTSIS